MAKKLKQYENSVVDELLAFIDADKFKNVSLRRSFAFNAEMLKFLISCKRLNIFLQGIKKTDIEKADANTLEKLDNVSNEICTPYFDTDNRDDIKEVVFIALIDMISDEVTNCKRGEMKSKKILNDLKRLNKLQKEIIEKHFFKDSIPNFLKRIGVKKEFFRHGDSIEFACDLLADLLFDCYFEADNKDPESLKILFDIEIKNDVMPTLYTLTQGTLTFDEIISLIPLLRGYAQSERDIETITGFWDTQEALLALSDILGLGIAMPIKRNEFHNAVKDAYQTYLELK